MVFDTQRNPRVYKDGLYRLNGRIGSIDVYVIVIWDIIYAYLAVLQGLYVEISISNSIILFLH